MSALRLAYRWGDGKWLQGAADSRWVGKAAGY